MYACISTQCIAAGGTSNATICKYKPIYTYRTACSSFTYDHCQPAYVSAPTLLPAYPFSGKWSMPSAFELLLSAAKKTIWFLNVNEKYGADEKYRPPHNSSLDPFLPFYYIIRYINDYINTLDDWNKQQARIDKGMHFWKNKINDEHDRGEKLW